MPAASADSRGPRDGVDSLADLFGGVGIVDAGDAADLAAQRPDRRERLRDPGPTSVPGGRRRAGEASDAGTAPAPTASRPTGRRGAEAPPTEARAARVAASGRPVGGRRANRAVRAVAALGFAALLAVATSVPALSLLTPDDVQALALTASLTAGDGQRMVVGDELALPGVDNEGYKHQTIQEYAEAAGIRAEATFTNNPAGTIQWPFKVGVHIGDRFGYRDCAGCSEDHHGQDFNPGYGAEIQAIADGVVSVSTDAGGSLGVVTMIDHVIDGEVVTSVYAHMQYDTRRFEVGDVVHVADVVGNTGSTGMSTGPHLHFEIRIGGVNGEWVDPLDWLYANTN
ncbi:peptidoglycan DD-metalloendopeptidase family protein [Agromyces sp. MMS24-K17]|uniref:M23 family metallopeptidase n=1 Tax=Agromyces sp. MMS24-K17 TaxID=3372850 RepID=UPI0037552EC1